MVKIEQGAAIVLNILARKQMQEALLRDILIDLTICELEGWSKSEYITELRELINGINLKKENKK